MAQWRVEGERERELIQVGGVAATMGGKGLESNPGLEEGGEEEGEAALAAEGGRGGRGIRRTQVSFMSVL